MLRTYPIQEPFVTGAFLLAARAAGIRLEALDAVETIHGHISASKGTLRITLYEETKGRMEALPDLNAAYTTLEGLL